MEKLVARPLSLGVAMPGANANVATGPVPPLLPQAPHVSQLVESCTLSITVLAGVEGVGVGDAAGVGVGEGFDVLLPFEATTEFAALPPQPMINVVSNAIETSESEVQLLCTAKSPKKIRPDVSGQIRSTSDQKVRVVSGTLKGFWLIRITANN
jgi:hypothetical protein